MRNILLLMVVLILSITARTQTATISPSGIVTICKGFGLLLSANTGAGYTYQWFLNDRTIEGQTSSQITVTSSGKYTVKIGTATTAVTSEPTTVNFVAMPRVSITYKDKTADICNTGSLELKANKVSGVTYLWYKNGDLIPGADQQIYMATAAGSYKVQITPLDKRCAVSSDPVVVTNSCGN